MSKLFHKIFLTCDEATIFIEKEKAGELSLLSRMRLKIHLLVCKWCEAYYHKVQFLDKVLKDIVSSDDDNKQEDKDITDFKERVKKKLKETPTT